MKNKVIPVLLLSVFVLSGCGFWGIRGNGHLKEEVRNVQDFQRIEAGGAFSIHVEVGPQPSVRISAEENLLTYIRTTVRGNQLVIDTKKNISPRKEIRIDITVPNLKAIEGSGANNITVRDIKGEEFEAELSGAGGLVLSGEVVKLRAELSGAGNINARELKASNVRVSVSGAANADVYAKESLDASVSGVGSIDYYGNPSKINTSLSGVGSINRK